MNRMRFTALGPLMFVLAFVRGSARVMLLVDYFRDRAREVRGVVRTSDSFVRRYLRVGTQRSSPLRLAVPDVRHDDPVRGLSLFDPFFDCADRIKGVGTIAPAAMVHPGGHEEAVEVSYIRGTSHKSQDAVVVVDAVQRRYRGVTPAVVLQQLSATVKEIPQIRVCGPGDAVINVIGERHRGIEIECREIPVSIMKYTVSQILARLGLRYVRMHPTHVGSPAEFTPEHQPRINLFSRTWIHRRAVERPGYGYLRVGQTIRTVLALALQGLQVEVTKARIPQKAVLDAVASVARRHYRVAYQGKLGRWNQPARILADRLSLPDTR